MVVTCLHVVYDEPVVVVKDINGVNCKVSRILAAKDRDIAVIELDESQQLSGPFLRIVDDVASLHINDKLLCYGNSEGTGVIVACDGKLIGIGPTSVETDTMFISGNSGGPIVLGSDYRVVGVASLITRLSEGNKWAKGTRFADESRHFAVRIDNLFWDALEVTHYGEVDEKDTDKVCEIAKRAMGDGEEDKAIGLYAYAAGKNDSKALLALGRHILEKSESNNEEAMAKGFELIHKAAEIGLAEAQYYLARCYAKGLGVEEDRNKAVEWCEKAALQGYDLAQYNLGLSYTEGDGVAKDDIQAAKWFGKAANQGHSAAQYYLGLGYAEGKGVAKDTKKAAEWFLKAAEEGFSWAQFMIGTYYEEGIVVAQNSKKAAEWFSKAAEQGVAAAQYRLGVCYAYGSGVEENEAKAAEWYSKAANQGDADAQYNLGMCYTLGKGIEKDPVKAVMWFTLAANQGLASAQFSLASCFDAGDGVRKDYSKAVEWYRKAADQGYPPAQNNLGACYIVGAGVIKDERQAFSWFSKAAAQGNVTSQRNVASCFEDGTGVEKNITKAFEWYLTAAEAGNEEARNKVVQYYSHGKGFEAKDLSRIAKLLQKLGDDGDAQAQYWLGNCYAKGEGVDKNPTKAFAWFHKAAEREHVQAQFALGLSYENGDGVNQDMTQAIHWFRKAADRNYGASSDAQYRLGLCYANGKGVEKNMKKAIEWYQKAARHGHFEAKRAVDKIQWASMSSQWAQSKEVKEAVAKLQTDMVRIPDREFAVCKLANGKDITWDTLGLVAWFGRRASSGGASSPVGQKQANAYGLYDMLGNVGEWTSTAKGDGYVFCGGGWAADYDGCEATMRRSLRPSGRGMDLGLRLVQDIVTNTAGIGPQ